MPAEASDPTVVEPERGRLHRAIDLLAAEIAALATGLCSNPRALVRIERLTKIIKALRAEAFVIVHQLSNEEADAARYNAPRAVPQFACGVDDVDMALAQDFEGGPNVFNVPPRLHALNPLGRRDLDRDADLAEIDAREARRSLDAQSLRKVRLEELVLIDHILSNEASAVAKLSRKTLEQRVGALTSSIGACDGDPDMVRADVVRRHPTESEEQEPDPGGDLQAHPL